MELLHHGDMKLNVFQLVFLWVRVNHGRLIPVTWGIILTSAFANHQRTTLSGLVIALLTSLVLLIHRGEYF